MNSKFPRWFRHINTHQLVQFESARKSIWYGSGSIQKSNRHKIEYFIGNNYWRELTEDEVRGILGKA